MIQWEYKWLHVKSHTAIYELNQAGAEGWEATGVVEQIQVPDMLPSSYLMKRRKKGYSDE